MQAAGEGHFSSWNINLGVQFPTLLLMTCVALGKSQRIRTLKVFKNLSVLIAVGSQGDLGA